MNRLTDSELLRDYAERRSETAFAELVQRHLDLVYSAAVRMVGDAHLAQDVAQGAFLALAQNARQLIDRPVLSGWLHRTARNIAANTVRSEIRRRAREQEAAAMNELLSNENDAPWDQVAPHLDAVLDELNDAERDALLLRYFERKSAREMAPILGISDEAAQKRVTRGLEHVRESLAKRAVPIATGGLVLAISAHAVQAAPAGLAATISTAAAVTAAGAAIQTSTIIAATKTIAMTTLQKSLLGATLLAAVGAGIYGAHENALVRDQVQAAQQQQAALAQKIDRLQRERDEATTQLTAVRAEIAQLKPPQTPAELLRLRGQVGSLRQQLATSEAKSNTPSTGFAKMMSDPAMREYINQALVDLIKRRYTPLFQELKLTPEQSDQFVQIMNSEYQKGVHRLVAAQQHGTGAADPAGSATDEKSDLNQKMQALLGQDGLARFGEYSQEVPARTTVDVLDGQLGASKLSDEQKARLFQIVKAEPFNLTHGISGDLDKAFFGSQAEVDAYLANIADSNQRVLQQAGAFLSADQLAALNTVLTNGITARVTQAAAFTQKH
jgi:RNA polymerase sigma factor (sigma-70 family)